MEAGRSASKRTREYAWSAALLGIALTSILSASSARAESDVVFVRARVATQRTIWVGQRVSIEVAVFSSEPTFDNALFDLPELDRSLFVQSTDAPYFGSETVNDIEYASKTYELLLFSQRDGPIVIPEIGVRLRTRSEAGEILHSKRTTPLELEVIRPGGVHSDVFLVTSPNVTIQQTWSREGGEASLGDAVERRVEISAEDVLGIALPPLAARRVAGLAAYPSDPQVRDQSSRGALTGSRIDSISFVVVSPGEHEIPPLSYVWWDPDSETLEEQVLPGLSLVVAVPPASALGESPGAPALGGRARFIGGSAFVVMVLLLAESWRRWGRRTHADWRIQRSLREPALARVLLTACKGSDANAVYAAWRPWLASCISETMRGNGTPTLEDLALQSPELARQAGALELALVDRRAFDGKALAGAVRVSRRRRSEQRVTAKPLAPLNPGSPHPL